MLNVARTETGEPEIFKSIQGEGPMAGEERTFIRLSGCNLHCRWCDTAYTWNWVGTGYSHDRDKPGAPYKFDPAREMVKLEIAEAAQRILAMPAPGVVITGGEPLLQADALARLIETLRSAGGVKVEVETNGSIIPSRSLADLVDLFVVSPKLSHSGNDEALAMRGLGAFAALDTAAFKFVARVVADVQVISEITHRYAIAPERVYVMPEGTESGALSRLAKDLKPAIDQAGLRFSDRLHIHLFGEKRGV